MNIETIYGCGIIEENLKKMQHFIVITDPIPWNLYQHEFQTMSYEVMMPGTLEKSELDRMINTIPENVEIVGLGGGAVIDAAKYFAYLRGKTPIIIPTITSSNAHFSDFISVRRNGTAFGFKKIGWPKKVIVDYDLIERADSRLNRAGFGDLLFMQTALNDWKLAAAKGKSVSVVSELEKKTMHIMQAAIANASEIGSVSKKGLDILMRLSEKSSFLIMNNLNVPLSAGAEHLFAWNFEHVTDRGLIHGELVSLGIIISSYLHKRHFRELKTALDQAHVLYHPDELKISWEEIKATLLTVREYNDEFRNIYTIFDEVEWTTEQLDEIYKIIYG